MKYHQPFGKPDEVVLGDQPYVNGDPSIGRAGSIPPAEAIEYTQREIMSVIRNAKRGDGTAFLVATDADLQQLAKIMQSQLFCYARDTGTANNYQVTLSPVPTEYYEGMTIYMKVLNPNTGTSVINVNALGAKSIRKMDGTILLGGDLGAGMEATLRYDGTVFQLVSASFGGVQRLTANKDLYVNNAIGNDANDGLSNTAGHALATIQRAVDIAFGYAPSQYAITIHISSGTYTAGGKTPYYPGPTLNIDGAGIAATIVAPTNDYGFLVQGPNVLTVTNVRVNSTVTSLGPACFAAANGAVLNTSDTANGPTNSVPFNASSGASLRVGKHQFNGNMYGAFWSTFNANISLLGAQLTMNTAIAVNSGFAWASGLGTISCAASVPTTFVNPGNVTGPKYLSTSNGFINADGQGVNFFPGNASGSTSLGGQYA